MASAKPIPCSPVPLRQASVEEYCRALGHSQYSSFWWYFFEHAPFRFSMPFKIRDATWWYQVKPGFCWPVEVLSPRREHPAGFPYCKSFIGYQYGVDGLPHNSTQLINTIEDLPNYSSDSIDAKRRNAVRKGIRECAVEPLRGIDEATAAECCAVWNDFTRRTGWKHPIPEGLLRVSWNELLGLPGATILVGREIRSGRIAGFLITKLLGDTAFVDTLASRTDLLNVNINDALMFTFLASAQRLPGIKKAHFAIRSYDSHLEDFKTSIGFKPLPFPMVTVMRPGISPVLRRLFPSQYRRMTGA
jgi:hypothetical protein